MQKRQRTTWCIAPLVLAAAGLICSCTPATRLPEHTLSTEASEMEPPAHIHHSIDYIEFTVTDMAESQRFYSEAFGWKFTDYAPDYAGIQGRGPGHEAGGFRLDSKASTGGPLVILYSDDLEATIASVRAAGGDITAEIFDFPGGRRFQFKDPSGNELAVWSDK